MVVNRLNLGLGCYWPERAYFLIYFYEWRHETNELIIAGTSEGTDEVVDANKHMLAGGTVLGFNYDNFTKYTFTP